MRAMEVGKENTMRTTQLSRENTERVTEGMEKIAKNATIKKVGMHETGSFC